MTNPTKSAPVRWRTEDIFYGYMCVYEGPLHLSLGATDPDIALQVVREHNALIAALDLAERGAPAGQIAELIRDELGLNGEATS